ncbi:hypothetical protein EDF24_1008 [Curtobacterium sp. PhB130]|uniref:LOG family protein n=1 Tax=unclassified Curtobacterium TaxID=257496 RepID=UPI000F4B0522|nr:MULTISPECIES: TIGR00730 family Rossman fold protein [unclassified Curtobacterium]ROP65182.1 hypothetical protein EDF55_1837 [Curtobacterium sp. ZW137]ROS78236.1 hypothetical protein EDF24_1008 [Curtobacterium sp. PhB130]
MDSTRTEPAIAVFCGSSDGTGAGPALVADELVRVCAARGIRIVHGGSDVGLMGRIVRTAHAEGCAVTGVTPHHLAAIEPPASGIDLVHVDTMAERKQRFLDCTDAVLVLPGGIGTLDEAFDALTGAQLGLHDLPVVFVDVDGFWQTLRVLLEHLRRSGFIALDREICFARTVDDALALAFAGTPTAVA